MKVISFIVISTSLASVTNNALVARIQLENAAQKYPMLVIDLIKDRRKKESEY